MERRVRKKESGAHGRKRRKLEAEEVKKSSKVLLSYFKPGTTSSTPSEEEPSTSSKSFLEHESESSPELSEAEEQADTTILEEKSYTSESILEHGDEASLKLPETEEEPSTTSRSILEHEGESSPKFSEAQEEVNIEQVKIAPDDTEPSESEGVKELPTVIPEVIKKHDIGLLKFDQGTGRAIVPDALRTELIQLGWQYFQNSEGPFQPTNNHSMSKAWFHRKLGDGHGVVVPRSWLLYSPFKKSAFCFCCLLYSRTEQQSTLEKESGFNHWKAPERMSTHEHSRSHRTCFIQWKEMERILSGKKGIDTALQAQIEDEKAKWREILTRFLHCIKYLATQNLALRGHRESLQVEEATNQGNFLGLVKLLAVFDPTMKEHLRHVGAHCDAMSYFSPTVQNEFIHMMASAVRQRLLRSIRQAKYYGLMFDSTPDQAHCEQMSEVVRFVEVDFERRKVSIREAFLGFILVSKKDDKSLTEDILRQLERDEMELQDCRSQCYDNAAVMAGHVSGVQKRMSEKNHLAVFVNYDNHSLNLVSVHAARQDIEMISFFRSIEAIYVFFSSSTQRWDKLKKALPVTVKSESETRWSARKEAVKPISQHIHQLLQLFQDMMEDEDETFETKEDARDLFNRMLSFDFLTLLVFWEKILTKIDCVQKRLQDPGMNFHNAAKDLQSLRNELLEKREVWVSDSIRKGVTLCQELDVEVERRPRCKKRIADEKASHAGLSFKKEMERVMREAIDRLHKEMDERFTRVHNIDSKFGFLLDIEGLCYGPVSDDLEKKCQDLGEFYRTDVDGQELYAEILDVRMWLSTRDKISSPEQLLEFVVEYGDENVFPNLQVAIQIMLTIAVSIASCERSFSKLKLILSYLRSSMGQDRLCDLALLSIENEETEKTDFDHIIDQFASVKARKVLLGASMGHGRLYDDALHTLEKEDA